MKTSDYLISQYYDSPRIRAVIDSLEDSIESDVLGALNDLLPQMTSKSIGYWADLLAKRFMVQRPVIKTDEETEYKFFGFKPADGESNYGHIAHFNEGTFASQGFDPHKYLPANDIIMSAFVNINASKIRYDGTQDMASRIVDDSFSGSYVIDNMDMTIDYVIGGDIEEYELSMFDSSDDTLPRPVGVEIAKVSKA